jgi:hypothetical protein
VIFALAFTILLQTPAPVGMVLQATGPVTLQHDSAKRPARIADLIYAGDRLETDAKGTAVVEYCPAAQKLSIGAGSAILFAASSFRSAKGGAPSTAMLKCSLPQVALGSESLEHVGAMRGRGDPPIALYTGGTLATARPLFRWEPVAGAKQYKLSITDENDKSIWSAERPAPLSEMLLDASIALKPGTSYRWELTAEADGKIVGRQSTSFEVKPNAELAAVPADPAVRLQHAFALENAGYFSEAAEIFRQIRAAQPDDARLTNHLVWLYWNAKLIEATNRELARLKR